MRFDKKVVIISGGGAGMGKASALGFAKEGAFVVINDLSEDNLTSTANEIKSIGGTVTTVAGDVTKSQVIQGIVEKTLKSYGKVDILFNYVGGSPGNAQNALFIEQNEEYWRKSIELNLLSTMIFCRAVLDSMIEQKYGKIINMSAAAGKIGTPRMAAYSAAKGGVISFTKALAKEMISYNINVNCICPGRVDTPTSYIVLKKRPGMPDPVTSNTAATSASSPGMLPRDFIARMARPEEIASAVLYLASDDASYITGQALSVDGGMTMV
jgi:NAD(P)-dependent dehydrogenase (short-subunit alcohol dehydrogenase family)